MGAESTAPSTGATEGSEGAGLGTPSVGPWPSVDFAAGLGLSTEVIPTGAVLVVIVAATDGLGIADEVTTSAGEAIVRATPGVGAGECTGGFSA